jgi:hypothetical protein
MLIARKDPRRHPRVAARWLLRYLEECDDATIDEAAMAAAMSERAARGKLAVNQACRSRRVCE